ncbi:MAG TPA: hypothetical protein VKK79_17870, partial [Candidatus Lokiarchaeia archaeon]|nr:hypothetical protein [Candidatus Lokiarchaeia archaeon]
ALSQKQVLFVSPNREQVERALSAFLCYFPNPSANIWATEISDALFIGTHPDLVKNYDPSTVVVDLVNDCAIGGEKNEFCANLLLETMLYSQEMSFTDSRIFFQGKISAIFTLLKSVLELLTIDESQRVHRLQEIFNKYPTDSLQLIIQMSQNLNQLLAKYLEISPDLISMGT